MYTHTVIYIYIYIYIYNAYALYYNTISFVTSVPSSPLSPRHLCPLVTSVHSSPLSTRHLCPLITYVRSFAFVCIKFAFAFSSPPHLPSILGIPKQHNVCRGGPPLGSLAFSIRKCSVFFSIILNFIIGLPTT